MKRSEIQIRFDIANERLSTNVQKLTAMSQIIDAAYHIDPKWASKLWDKAISDHTQQKPHLSKEYIKVIGRCLHGSIGLEQMIQFYGMSKKRQELRALYGPVKFVDGRECRLHIVDYINTGCFAKVYSFIDILHTAHIGHDDDLLAEILQFVYHVIRSNEQYGPDDYRPMISKEMFVDFLMYTSEQSFQYDSIHYAYFLLYIFDSSRVIPQKLLFHLRQSVYNRSFSNEAIQVLIGAWIKWNDTRFFQLFDIPDNIEQGRRNEYIQAIGNRTLSYYDGQNLLNGVMSNSVDERVLAQFMNHPIALSTAFHRYKDDGDISYTYVYLNYLFYKGEYELICSCLDAALSTSDPSTIRYYTKYIYKYSVLKTGQDFYRVLYRLANKYTGSLYSDFVSACYTIIKYGTSDTSLCMATGALRDLTTLTPFQKFHAFCEEHIGKSLHQSENYYDFFVNYSKKIPIPQNSMPRHKRQHIVDVLSNDDIILHFYFSNCYHLFPNDYKSDIIFAASYNKNRQLLSKIHTYLCEYYEKAKETTDDYQDNIVKLLSGVINTACKLERTPTKKLPTTYGGRYTTTIINNPHGYQSYCASKSIDLIDEQSCELILSFASYFQSILDRQFQIQLTSVMTKLCPTDDRVSYSTEQLQRTIEYCFTEEAIQKQRIIEYGDSVVLQDCISTILAAGKIDRLVQTYEYMINHSNMLPTDKGLPKYLELLSTVLPQHIPLILEMMPDTFMLMLQLNGWLYEKTVNDLSSIDDYGCYLRLYSLCQKRGIEFPYVKYGYKHLYQDCKRTPILNAEECTIFFVSSQRDFHTHSKMLEICFLVQKKSNLDDNVCIDLDSVSINNTPVQRINSNRSTSPDTYHSEIDEAVVAAVNRIYDKGLYLAAEEQQEFLWIWSKECTSYAEEQIFKENIRNVSFRIIVRTNDVKIPATQILRFSRESERTGDFIMIQQ